MKFKVVSGRLAGAKEGQIVDSSDLEGCNIGALLGSGHIVSVESKIKSDVKSESTED